MKKNKYMLLLTLSLILSGCNVSQNNSLNIASNSNVVSQEEIVDKAIEETEFSLSDLNNDDLTILDMRYYNKIFSLVNKFYGNFELIGNAIDSNDKDLIENYMIQLEKTNKEINEIIVPEHFISSHSYLVDGTKLYIDGLNSLITSYNNANYDKYKDSDKILLSAGDSIQIYLQYIEEFTSTFAEYLDTLTQIDFYFKTITIYDYNDKFSENDNKVLFTIERNICNFVNIRENLINNVLNDKSINDNIDDLKNIIDNINKLQVENESLNKYKTNLITYLNNYYDFNITFVDKIRKNDYNNNFLKEMNVELQNFGFKVYDNLSNLSDFYASYGIDLGFKDSQTQLQEYNQQMEVQQ